MSARDHDGIYQHDVYPIRRKAPVIAQPVEIELTQHHPSPYVLVPLYNRATEIVGWAHVDAADALMVAEYRWRRTFYGYADAGTGGTHVWMHRLILGLEQGDSRQGDHINGDRLDNRRSNLRIVTNAQNSQNQSAKGGTSQHRGVSFRKDTGRWTGYVKVNYERYCAGCFDTEEEAAEATRALRAKLMPYYQPERDAA